MADRWFFALWPDPGVRAGIAEACFPLVPPRAQAVHPADLHLTLAFLGVLEPSGLACVESVAGGVNREPFELALNRVGYFVRSQVLWCGPDVLPESLVTLVARLQAGLSDCGIQPERRACQPHLTLARKVRVPPQADMQTGVDWSVRDFVLASGRGGRIPRYQVYRRWALAEVSA